MLVEEFRRRNEVDGKKGGDEGKDDNIEAADSVILQKAMREGCLAATLQRTPSMA